MTATTDFEKDIIDVLGELTQDWDSGFSGEMTSDTTIVAGLGFESLDVVHLISAIEQKYDRSDFPFEDLLMVDGHYVEDLTVKEIADFVSKHMA